MYRKGSFGGSNLSLSNKSTGLAQGVPGDEIQASNDQGGSDMHSSHVLFLKTQGKFGSTALPTQVGGRLMTIWNYPLRSKLWRITLVAFHPRTGTFALADERGQVYRMSMHQHTYQALRTASMPITAMCFVACEKTHLILAHANNGTLLIIDTHKRDVIGNIQLLQADAQSVPVVRILRSHPSQPQLLIGTEDNRVFLWDLNTMQCLRTLQCEDRIVDIRYELHGDIIALTLERRGTFLYANDGSFASLGSCRLPKPIPSTTWITAYASILYRVYFEEEKRTRWQLNILLATSDNRLLSFYVGIDRQPTKSTAKATTAGNIMAKFTVETKLFGAFPLPKNIAHAVSMMFVGEVSSVPRLSLLSYYGEILLLESDGFQEHSPGIWTVVAEIGRDIAQQTREEAGVYQNLLPALPCYSSTPTNNAAVAANTPANKSANANAISTTTCGCISKMDASYEHLVVVSLDGAARLFVHQDMAGVGNNCGKVLKATSSHGHASNHSSTASSHASNATSQKAVAAKGSLGPPQRPVSAPAATTSGNVSPAANIYDFFLSTDTGDIAAATSSVIPEAAVQKPRSTKKTLRHSTTRNKSAIVSSDAKSGTAVSTKRRNTIGQTVARRVKWQSHSFLTGNTQHVLGRHQDEDMLQMPLFELATLTPTERQVNRMKLEAFLHTNGEYPDRYRPLIWRFLLRLPENASAFSELVKRGIHASFEDLQDTYPIKSPKLFGRLQHTLSNLAHWAPILSQATYLPALVFPFTLIYTNDEMATLETVMTILMYWGYSWHATHPHPPSHLVDSINKLLKLHEVKVYQHLMKLDCNPGLIGWTLISTLCTEICGRKVWLTLMDFLFTYFEDMRHIILLPIAIIRELKTILCLCETPEKVIHAYRNQQQNLRMDFVLKSIEEMKRATPAKYFTGVATKFLDDTRFEVGRKANASRFRGASKVPMSSSGVSSPGKSDQEEEEEEVEDARLALTGESIAFGSSHRTQSSRQTGGHIILDTAAPSAVSPRHKPESTGFGFGNKLKHLSQHAMDESDEARLNLALSNGTPRFPLPAHVSQYPVYDGYPQEVLDIQIRERNKVLMLSKEVSRRESSLQALEKKIEEIEKEHATWMLTHEHATKSEFAHHRLLMEQETQYYRELQRIEEDIVCQRIRALESLETAAKEELRVMDLARHDTEILLAEKEKHVQSTMSMNLMLQKHREVSEKAEHTTMEKLRQLRLRRTREDWLRSVSSLMKNKEEELTAETVILQEKWKRQDDELRAQRERKQQELLEREELDRMALIQEEIAQKMQRLQLDRDAKLLEIERLRAVRLAQAQADDANEAAERAAMFVKKQQLYDLAAAKSSNNLQETMDLAGGPAQSSTASSPTGFPMYGYDAEDAALAERAVQIRELKARHQARHAQLQQTYATQFVDHYTTQQQQQQQQQQQVHSRGNSSSHKSKHYAKEETEEKSPEVVKRRYHRDARKHHLQRQQQQLHRQGQEDEVEAQQDTDFAPQWETSTSPVVGVSANVAARKSPKAVSGLTEAKKKQWQEAIARANSLEEMEAIQQQLQKVSFAEGRSATDHARAADDHGEGALWQEDEEAWETNNYTRPPPRKGLAVLESTDLLPNQRPVGSYSLSASAPLPLDEAWHRASAALLAPASHSLSTASYATALQGDDRDLLAPSWNATTPHTTASSGVTAATLTRKASNSNNQKLLSTATTAAGAYGNGNSNGNGNTASGTGLMINTTLTTATTTSNTSALNSSSNNSSTGYSSNATSPMKLLSRPRSSFHIPSSNTSNNNSNNVTLTNASNSNTARVGGDDADNDAEAIQRSLRNIKAGISSVKKAERKAFTATEFSPPSSVEEDPALWV